MSRFRAGGIALLLAVVLWVGALPGARAESTRVMGKMPAWKMVDSTGRTVSSASLAGKVLIVDFWASWCPPCRREIPGFIALQQKYGSRGLQVVGFSLDETAQEHTDYVRSTGFNYPSFFVNNSHGKQLTAQFEKVIGTLEGIPTTVVVNRQGNIVYSHVGYAPQETFENLVVPLLGR